MNVLCSYIKASNGTYFFAVFIKCLLNLVYLWKNICMRKNVYLSASRHFSTLSFSFDNKSKENNCITFFRSKCDFCFSMRIVHLFNTFYTIFLNVFLTLQDNLPLPSDNNQLLQVHPTNTATKHALLWHKFTLFA